MTTFITMSELIRESEHRTLIRPPYGGMTARCPDCGRKIDALRLRVGDLECEYIRAEKLKEQGGEYAICNTAAELG